jgi:universal stress protein C
VLREGGIHTPALREIESYDAVLVLGEDLTQTGARAALAVRQAVKGKAEYPITRAVIATGELSEHILNICQNQQVDLVICGNHNQSFFSRATCSAKTIVSSSKIDVLLIPLGGR